jgi:hypothetical protein
LLAAGYLEMNLVSNQAGAALLQDPNLNLPWGIAVAPAGGDFFISETGNGKVTLYGGDVNGSPLTENPLVVSIPGGFPTADVFNNSGSATDFTISSNNGSGPAKFLFASLDGKISAWNPDVSSDHAVQVAQVNGAYFTGLAIGNNGSGNLLYAADFQNGKIDVFDGSFHQTSLSGSFNDPNLPAGYAPFNVQNIDGKLYVTYAVQQASSQHATDNDDDDQGDNNNQGDNQQEDSAKDKGPGNGHGPGGGQDDQDDDDQNGGGSVFTPAATGGIVDVFDLNGNLLNRFATNGTLNAPWGLAMAPAGFGQFGGDLLVGNFGDGKISAFKADGTLDGQLNDAAGDPISIHHLLGLSFGNGATAGDAGTLFFTADAASLSSGLASSGNGIILLDGSGSGALREVGNASVNVANGAITVDSSNGGAIFLAGNPSLSATQLNVVGAPGLTTHGHPSVNVGGAVNSGVASLADPLASLSAPALPSATFNGVNATGNANLTLQPGVYNGGISVGDNSTVTLMPGVYYLQGGGISVTGQGTLQGHGVTIYVSGGGGSAVKVSGHGVVNLTAPSSGDLQSVALFLARGGQGGIQITGQGVVNLTGTVSASNGTFNVVGSHTYAATGQYPVKVTIQDVGGATATANTAALLGSSDFDSDDQFVSDAFEDILERLVDRASLLFFVNALEHGLSRQQFASLLTHSDEFLERGIRQDYQRFLGRDADDGGLNFWLSRLRGGMTDEQLEAQFIGSSEFFQHSGGTNKSWVDEMYFDLLGRLPDAQGEAYWIQVLSGGGSRSNVALGFAGSSEREGATVQNDYQTFLGRDAGSTEVANWVGAFRNGMTNEQVISGFVGSDEYFSHHGGHGNGHGNGNGNGNGNGHGHD